MKKIRMFIISILLVITLYIGYKVCNFIYDDSLKNEIIMYDEYGNKPLEEVLTKLKKQGFKTEVVYMFDEIILKDRVIHLAKSFEEKQNGEIVMDFINTPKHYVSQTVYVVVSKGTGYWSPFYWQATIDPDCITKGSIFDFIFDDHQDKLKIKLSLNLNNSDCCYLNNEIFNHVNKIVMKINGRVAHIDYNSKYSAVYPNAFYFEFNLGNYAHIETVNFDIYFSELLSIEKISFDITNIKWGVTVYGDFG